MKNNNPADKFFKASQTPLRKLPNTHFKASLTGFLYALLAIFKIWRV